MIINQSGLVLIDKPQGITSFNVVALARRKLSERYHHKIKVGHCGTLDPFATGLLLLVTNNECKNARFYSKLDKTYCAQIFLGATSSTGDSTGQIESTSDFQPTIDQVKRALCKFQGIIYQTPPKYSAIKINGKRAYKLARQNIEFVMPKRQVTIYNIELIDYHYPLLYISTKVSSGTYIRTLAEDIGKDLTTGAYCKELRRVAIGEWSIEQSSKLEDL